MLNEENIIHFFKKDPHLKNDIGDDAALFEFTKTNAYLVTKDMLIEERHFRLKYFDPRSLAQKAIESNLSDLAAMGAEPRFILLGLAIPENFNEAYLNAFLQAFSLYCQKKELMLLGGDTTASPDKLFISITAIGQAKHKYIKKRTTAQIGDIITHVGHLGYAHLGLCSLEQGLGKAQDFEPFALRPLAQVDIAQALAKEQAVHAMMDLSDGLLIDLERLVKASDKSAILFLEAFPKEESFVKACEDLGLDPFSVQLTGGEDYGLLCTIDKEAFDKIQKRYQKNFDLHLPKLGIITAPGEIPVQSQIHGKLFNPNLKKFSHFHEK